MSGFTKLFSSILDSTVWREPDSVRILWIALLALADQDGHVYCSVPGLADRARISIEQCEAGLTRFQQPDKYSASQEDDGRRIRIVDRGWQLINYGKYRHLMSLEERKEKARIRQQRHRDLVKSSRAPSHPVTPCNASNDIAEAEAEAKAEAVNTHAERDPQSVVAEIAKEHPALTHQTRGPSRRIQEAIIQAVVRDGHDLVLAGTRNLRDAVAKWPKEEHRFVPEPVKFYEEQKYLCNPVIWERGAPLSAIEDFRRRHLDQ